MIGKLLSFNKMDGTMDTALTDLLSSTVTSTPVELNTNDLYIDLLNMDGKVLKMMIDYQDTLPKKYVSLLKLHLDNPQVFGKIQNSKKINMSPMAPWFKTFEKFGFEISQHMNIELEGTETCYQSRVSYIRDYLKRNLANDAMLYFKLDNLVCSKPSFDNESMLSVESEVYDIITSKEFEKIPLDRKMSLVKFINNELIPYKITGYDLYTYLVMTKYFLVDVDSCKGLTDAYMPLELGETRGNKDGLYYHNLSQLIYLYAKKIEASPEMIKKITYRRIYLDGVSDYKYIEEKIEHYIEIDMPMEEVIGDLLYHYPSHYYDNFLNVPIGAEVVANQSVSENGSMFLFKNQPNLTLSNIEVLTKDIDDMDRAFIAKLWNLNHNKKCSVRNINFFLTDNDFGNIVRIPELQIGSFYSFKYKCIRTIGYNSDNEFFLFFKITNDPNIYAINTKNGTEIKDMDKRLVIIIERNRNYTFKYQYGL